MTDRLGELSAAGVAVWLDDLSRVRLTSGSLAKMLKDQHVVGVTTNPSIFQKALSDADAYDQQVGDLARMGVSVEEAVRLMTARDVRGFSAQDNGSVVVRVGADKYYELQGLQGCGDIDWTTRVGLQSRSGSSFICAGGDADRMAAMKKVNPKFVARGWVLDEVIRRVEKEGDRDVLATLMPMVLDPFAESWAGKEEEERWCGDVPRALRGGMCSCSS